MSHLSTATAPDFRHLSQGRIISATGYCDQPYLVKTDDGAWLVVMTINDGFEGQRGQHLITLRSEDRGATWGNRVALEPPDGPEASYAVLLKVPGGRIYAFYNHNTEEIREILGENGEKFQRVDSQGHYVFKYSDDHGHTWSASRYEVAIRPFAADLNNTHGGKVRFFWNVGRPFIGKGKVFLPHIKIGAMGKGFYAQDEGAILYSANILTEKEPSRIKFITLPDGDVGLRTPPGGGRVAEEQSIVQLSEGSLYCVYRTVDGHPACTYSRDEGRTWEAPRYASFANGSPIKHPRAANFVWKCGNGRYLYWFHNQGGTAAVRDPKWDRNGDRNPAWLSCGVEVDSPEGKRLAWSQPEIVLYDDDPCIRISYPDLLEDGGEFFISETQKTIARLHPLDPEFLDLLFHQQERNVVARGALLLEQRSPSPEIAMPELPSFFFADHSREDQAGKSTRAGVSLEFIVQMSGEIQDQILFASYGLQFSGLRVIVSVDGRVRVEFSDGRGEGNWTSAAGRFSPGQRHHLVIIIDGGPRIITFVIDGVLEDGGAERQFGWGRFSPHLRHINGASTARINSGMVQLLRIYGKALRTSEAVGNHRAEIS